MHLVDSAPDMNALREVFKTSRDMFVIALLGTFPGYWFTEAFIEKIGHFKIQVIGFFMMSFFMIVIGLKYDNMKNNKNVFALLYGLTFFFANFGPNSTTFVLPAELFPTRVRSTCHALSTASAKAGPFVAAFGVQDFTQGEDPGKSTGRSLEEISGEDPKTDPTPSPNSRAIPRQQRPHSETFARD